MADGAQEKIYELLGRTAPPDEQRSFGHFNAADTGKGDALAAELSEIAARDGVDAAISRAYEVADEGSLGIAKYALKLFVTHDDEAARNLTIPSVEISDGEPLPPASETWDEEENA
ncbi:MAG TPA: hypothetical protein VFS60_05610 [Thermoanaerobaculia bacterium]|nr:hypothetical protein [Thermoanaerobaculia bacterium]